MYKHSKIYVAGHTGAIGSVLTNRLRQLDYSNLLVKRSVELDLCNQAQVEVFFSKNRPEYVFICAGKILDFYKYPADVLFQNCAMQLSIINSAARNGVKKLLFISSGAIYPLSCNPPLLEVDAYSGFQKGVMQPYAVAKLVGMELCRCFKEQYGCDFISCIPTHVYGGNRFKSVIGEFLKAILSAKIANLSSAVVDVWGDGTAKKQFVHISDCVEAMIFLMNSYEGTLPVNIAGEVISLNELIYKISAFARFEGELIYPNKNTKIIDRFLSGQLLEEMGFKFKYTLDNGIKEILDLNYGEIR